MPFLVTLQWSRLAVPAETFAARCPPCLNGYTSARHASMVTHLPAMLQWSHISPPCLIGLTFASLPQWSHICLPASMVTHLPPCLNGHTLSSLPQWSHISLPASMVSHLPPCLNGYTSAASPQWLHICPPCFNGYTIPSTPHALTNCPATTSAPRKPPFCGLAAPIGTCSAPLVSRHPASREARCWPSCADKMSVAVSHSH